MFINIIKKFVNLNKTLPYGNATDYVVSNVGGFLDKVNFTYPPFAYQ